MAHKVHWTLLEPNHALKELEMRYAISSSVKALIHANNNVLCVHYSAKQGRDSRFFAANRRLRAA
ncbi:hypothetical protein HMPREF1578_01497 [Gardnerella pickettii JCP8017B]|nr:hypothetical protein HMPREF1578_01497 [Gardnerella pickettii JCP8017B]